MHRAITIQVVCRDQVVLPTAREARGHGVQMAKQTARASPNHQVDREVNTMIAMEGKGK